MPTLKLPSMTSGPVQKFARKDVNQPLREAQQKAQLTQAITSAVQTGVQLKAEHDISQSDLQVKSEVDQFERDNKATEFFDRETLKAEGFDTSQFDVLGGDNTQPIPRDQVYADLYKKKMDDSLKLAATKISNPKQRELWLRDKQAVVDTNYTKAVVQGLKDQQVRFQKERIANISEAIDTNEFSVAREVTSQIADPAIRKEVGIKVGKAEETHDYEEIIRTEDIDKIDGALEKLQEEKYRDKGGKLDDRENITEQTRLRAAKARIIAAREGRSGRDKSLATDEVKKFTTNLLSGKPVADLSALNGVIQRGLDKGVTEANMVHLTSAVKTYDYMQGMMQQPQVERDQLLREFMDMDSYSNLSATELESAKQNMQAAVTKANNEQADDNFSWAVEQYNLQVPPMDMSSPQSIAVSMAARVEMNGQIEAQTGKEAYLLSKNEAKAFSDKLLQTDAGTKIAMLTAINQELGDNAWKFIEPMEAHLPGELVVGAQLLQDGQRPMVESVLEGTRLIKDGQQVFNSKAQDFEPAIKAAIGGAFGDNNVTTKQMKETIYSQYAYLSDMANDTSGDLDPERLQQAVNGVTGGLADYNGRQVYKPAYGMTDDQFEGWIDNISTEKLRAAGGVAGAPHADRLVEGIDNGNIQMVSVGRGRYVLRDMNTKQYLANSAQTEPFILEYSPSDPTTRVTAPVGRGSAKVASTKAKNQARRMTPKQEAKQLEIEGATEQLDAATLASQAEEQPTNSPSRKALRTKQADANASTTVAFAEADQVKKNTGDKDIGF